MRSFASNFQANSSVQPTQQVAQTAKPIETGSTEPTDPSITKTIHSTTLTVDDLLRNLLYFRQIDKAQNLPVYNLLQKNMTELKRFAPNVKTIQQWLSGGKSSFEDSLTGADRLSAGDRKKLTKMTFTYHKSQAKFLYDTSHHIIKFFEQMHSLFPKMTEDEFYQKVFIAKTEGSLVDGEGVKDIIEALTEIPPVQSKTKKSTSSRRQKEREKMKPITNNPSSLERLTLFADLLEYYATEHNSQPATEFVASMRQSLKLS